MKPTAIIATCATLIALVATAGTAHWLDSRHEPRKPYPKATPPPPPSPIFTPSDEPVLTEQEIDAQESDHTALLERQLAHALGSRDAQLREAAFTFLMPELLQVEPQRAVALFERQAPGEARNVLLQEIARQWINLDRDAALSWMKSLEEDSERRAGAAAAAESLVIYAAGDAMSVAEQFGLGRERFDPDRRMHAQRKRDRDDDPPR